MPMYEATVRTPNGEEKKRVYADTPQEAKRLHEITPSVDQCMIPSFFYSVK